VWTCTNYLCTLFYTTFTLTLPHIDENFNFEVAVVYVEVEYYYSFIPLETNASELKSIIKSSYFKEYLNKKGSMLETITNN